MTPLEGISFETEFQLNKIRFNVKLDDVTSDEMILFDIFYIMNGESKYIVYKKT